MFFANDVGRVLPDISPDRILEALAAHMSSKYLFLAADIGVFEQLAEGPLTLEEFAGQIGMPQRTARILLDALVTTAWLVRDGDAYANTPTAAAFLSGAPGATDLRPLLQMWESVVYPQWATLKQALLEDTVTLGYRELTPLQRELFSRGVDVFTNPSAHALVRGYDLSRHTSLLDLGGGMGSFIRAILRSKPELRAGLFEMPETAALARRKFELEQLPVEVFEGDLREGPIPSGFDAYLLANVVHLFGQDRNQMLFSNIRASADAGARLLVVDMWTNVAKTEPALAALMAGEFQIVSGEGDVYSVEEASQWLEATGWHFIEHIPLYGSASLIVAEAKLAD